MINLSNVKAITHNNKQVTKIADHLGNIIWQSGPAIKTKTITITVGAASLNPDIPRDQSVLQLNFPTLGEIKTYIYATYGDDVQSFNSILFNKNSVYFKQNSTTSTTPYVNSVDSTTMTSPYTSGSAGTSTSVRTFGTGTWNITNYLNENSIRTFYGYYRRSSSYTKFNYSGGNYFCSSGGATTFTITLTISYNYLEDQGDWFTLFEGSNSLSYPTTAGASTTGFWWYFKPLPVGTQIRITYSFSGTYNRYYNGAGVLTTTAPSNPWVYTITTSGGDSNEAYYLGNVYQQATNNTAECKVSYWVVKSGNYWYSYLQFTATTGVNYTRTYGPTMTITKIEFKLPD